MNRGGVGAHGQLTQGANLRNPTSKYKRSKNIFSVTCIALIVLRVCTTLLQRPALVGRKPLSRLGVEEVDSHEATFGFLERHEKRRLPLPYSRPNAPDSLRTEQRLHVDLCCGMHVFGAWD